MRGVWLFFRVANRSAVELHGNVVSVGLQCPFTVVIEYGFLSVEEKLGIGYFTLRDLENGWVFCGYGGEKVVGDCEVEDHARLIVPGFVVY